MARKEEKEKKVVVDLYYIYQRLIVYLYPVERSPFLALSSGRTWLEDPLSMVDINQHDNVQLGLEANL